MKLSERSQAMMLFPLFLAITFSVFWQPGKFFFIMDDWTDLFMITEYPFLKYLFDADAEMWRPFSRFIYYISVRAFGDHYDYYLVVNCFLTSINALLIFIFLRKNLNFFLAFILSSFYSLAAVHSATVHMAYYINAIICVGFFISAIIITDKYLSSPSNFKLVGICLLCWFSLISWNITIAAIWTLPLYALFLGNGDGRKMAMSVGLSVLLASILFTIGYLVFAGFRAVTSHNKEIVTALPGLQYFYHWFLSAFIYPYCYLFASNRPSLAIALPLGLICVSVCLGIIWRLGNSREKKLAVWALLVNALPFVLVSLARYKLGVFQGGSHRYGVFTLLGALLLFGTALKVLSRNLPNSFHLRSIVPLLLLGVMIFGQFAATPGVRDLYAKMSGDARQRYDALPSDRRTLAGYPVPEGLFCGGVHPFLKNSQAKAIKDYLLKAAGG